MIEARYSIPPILFSLVFLSGFPSSGFAQRRPGIETSVVPPEGCFLDGTADPDDLYSFIRVEIQALAFARDGEKSDRDLLSAKEGPPIDKMAHLLAGLREERIQNSCAGFVLSPYAKSRNEYIASASGYLVNAYNELGEMTDQMLQMTLMETMLQKSGRSAEIELTRLKDRRAELLKYMALALDVSLSLLLDPHLDSNGKHDRIVLNMAQRNALMSYLNSKFPALKNDSTKTDADGFTAQASRIRLFLSGTYKPSDQ